MRGVKVSKRFAKSLLELSTEQKVEDKVMKDMELIHNTCHEAKDLNVLLNNPIIHESKKAEVLQAIFKGNVESITLDFITLITKHNRENYLSEITEAFIQQYKEAKGIIDVEFISAVSMDKGTEEKVLEKIKKKYSGTLNIKRVIDESVKGGFIVRVGDEQIDMTIARKLNDYKQLLLQ